MHRSGALAIALSLLSAPVFAQVQSVTFVSGLTAPVAFVQDPSDPSVQFVVEQAGHIRVVQGGTLRMPDFLDLSDAIVSGGEQGLLGLAFSPDYAASGRFFVDFTDPSGSTVVARFNRSEADPLSADPTSRFDLLWSTGERVIRRPTSGHNGGNLAFGPDGYLYIGMGDGGSGDEPDHVSQDPSSLLGKMLRLDVGVPESDEAGFLVPPDNPFVGIDGTLPEIWSFGFRNPWRWSFDDPALGGTGALVIGDVGQSSFEEVDYEPAGHGGRNYGWDTREGAHDYDLSDPPAFEPVTDPIFEYTHSGRIAITGGFVYRGTQLSASFRGRYFFADLIGRVWSLALSIDPDTGEATASDVREHTLDLGGNETLGAISSFGVDASGELYIVSYGRGVILRLRNPVHPVPLMSVDAPASGARMRQPFFIGGWAADAGAVVGTGVDMIHVWAYPATGGPAVFVGQAGYGGARPDIGAFLGESFTPSGFGLLGRRLAQGGYLLVVYARLTATGTFDMVRLVDVTIESGASMALDIPSPSSTVSQPFIVGGWALDAGADSGTGVDTIHVYASPDEGPPVFLGVPVLGGSRPDVGAFFGSQFDTSGYNLLVSHLAAGTWTLVVYVHSSVSGAFEIARVVRVTSVGF